MDGSDDDAALEIARAIRPYLGALIGPAAAGVDQRLAAMLRSARRGEPVDADIRSLLSEHDETADFAEEMLADAPFFRPPDLQDVTGRGGFQPVPGDITPVRHAGRFVCSEGDYVWYRPSVGAAVPTCPTHGLRLARET
jgi:hypothetical protein